MKLATWEVVKKWLNLDFDDNKDAVENMVNGIEGYLTVGTGLNLDTLKEDNETAYALARGYLQQKLYAQYYGVSDDRLEISCQGIIEQLKLLALVGLKSVQ